MIKNLFRTEMQDNTLMRERYERSTQCSETEMRLRGNVITNLAMSTLLLVLKREIYLFLSF